MKQSSMPRKHYEKMHEWDLYAKQLHIELRQSLEEGLEIEQYRPLFESVIAMPLDENKEKAADILYDIVSSVPLRENYPYREPSDLASILDARNLSLLDQQGTKLPDDLADRIRGAWYGRIIGCLLGKPVEGMRTDELLPLLKGSGNYPMYRYILSSDVTEEQMSTYRFKLAGRCFADTVDAAPVDDDTNYTVLYQMIVEKYGRDFTPYDVSRMWVSKQSKNAYCTAERVAFLNFVNGYLPPDSAVYKNPYREWVGAQIRGDYFGYINPGDPVTAADMAWRDASVSHIKNGIYGEMFISAAIACAAVTDDVEQILLGGLSQIPATSRLYEAVMNVIERYRQGESAESFFADLHTRWDEFNVHDWCHTISNAEIVAASMLWCQGDFNRAICMAVETGFDTDCNGATIGSILGMRGGMRAIGNQWIAPLHGKLKTSIFGVDTVEIESLIERTMKHIENK